MTKEQIQNIRELANQIKVDCAQGSRIWVKANKILELTRITEFEIPNPPRHEMGQ